MQIASRAYSTIEIKSLSDDKREISGIATTPSTDRVGDVVEPLGAQFKLPIPLLWQHDHSAPIGEVYEAVPTSKGIKIKARLVEPNADMPSAMVARLQEAWQSIKTGLVRGLSVGFNPQEWNILDSGGYRFTKWGWHELSAVTIPANAEASITSIKSLDQQQRAALGNKLSPVVRLIPPAGASATKSVKTKPQEGKDMNIQEQIQGYQETLKQKSARMAEIMEKSAAAGTTLDAAEAEEFETLEAEVKSVEQHIARLEKMEALNVKTAKAVPGTPAAAGQRESVPAVAKRTEKLEPGIEFARFAMCLGAAKGDLHTAKSIAESRFPQSERINVALKAAVAAGTTTDATWAAPLVEYNQFAGDFVEFLRPQTIIGKFGQGGIPALRSIPFNVHVRGQTSGGSGYWVGQGAPKPLTKFDFNDAYLGFTKVANIAVLTEELMRFSNPSAERLVRDSLAAALIERLDTDFIDPSFAGSANVSPASITNGVAAIPSSGADADAIRQDVASAMTTFIAANITPASGVWIMSATTALALSLMRNPLGQKEFPEITMLGGMFEGLPVIVSEYVGGDSSGRYVVLANASDIWLADDGNVMIEASREASLQMLDNPTNHSGTATPTTMVSMFQTNSVAIRAERYINWKKRRAAAVTYISGVNWGG